MPAGCWPAYIERLRTGTGCLVSASLLEFGLAGLGTVLASVAVSGREPGLLGTHSPLFAPYGGFRTADGWLVMAGAGSEQMWQRACAALGLAGLADDPRFADGAARVAHRDELTATIEAVLTGQPTEHWRRSLEKAGVPAAEVRGLAGVLGWPQVAALGSLQELPAGAGQRMPGGRAAVPARPGRAGLSGARAGPRPRHPPRAGRTRLPGGRGGGPGGHRGGGGGMIAGALGEAVLRRTVELAEIPAPTGQEGARRERVRSWWQQDGWDDVRADEVGNLWARVRPGWRPGVVLAAHLDTVFDETVDHRVRRDGARLRGPGVGDDSVGVAALSAIGRLLAGAGGTTPVWLVATVGEEGLGNLRGISEVIRQDLVPLAAVVAIEGNYLGRVATVGVGSVRWRVTVSGPGGHAWEQAAAPSAVHAAAGWWRRSAACPAAAVRVRGAAPARSSVNVGLFSGGEAVNARARRAVFHVDLRATGSAALADLEDAGPSDHRRRGGGRSPPRSRSWAAGLPASWRRPTRWPGRGGARCARPACPPAFTAASTDANAAHAAGVPAIAIGVTTGARRAHPGRVDRHRAARHRARLRRRYHFQLGGGSA